MKKNFSNLKNQTNSRKRNKIYPCTDNVLSIINSNETIKQPPLEIINEINADATRESFYENSSNINKNLKNLIEDSNKEFEGSNNYFKKNVKFKDNEINNDMNNQFTRDYSSNQYIYKKKIENEDFDHSDLYLSNFLENNKNLEEFLEQKNLEYENYNSERILKKNNETKLFNQNIQFKEINIYNINKSLNKYYSSFQGYKNNQPSQTKIKKPQGIKEDRWKSIHVTNIVSARILLSKQEGIDIILNSLINFYILLNLNLFIKILDFYVINFLIDIICFQSELRKLNNFIINTANKELLNYTNRFCVLNKICLKVFKSRENFLTLQKPQMEIYLNSIKYCNYLNINNVNNKINKASHFLIQYTSLLMNENKSEDKLEGNILSYKFNFSIKIKNRYFNDFK